MNCAFCKSKIPNNSIFCNFCGKKIDGEVKITPNSTEKNLPIPTENNKEQQWGIHLEQNGHQNRNDCPDWVKPIHLRNWIFQGVVVWNKEGQQVTKLWANQSLKLLDDLRSTSDWKENGVVIGEPVVMFSLEMSKKKKKNPTENTKGKWILENQMHLSAKQAEILFNFIQANEEILKGFASKDEEEKGKRLVNAYRSLLGDDLYMALRELRKTQPEEALRLTKEGLEIALGVNEK